MNKKLLSTALSALLLLFAGGQRADAASWRINTNANRHAHFADINAAMASSDVTDGDVLYLDPGCLITSTQNVTKRVTIIGTGYFPQNDTHQQACINANIYMKAANSKLEGVTVNGIIYIGANNVTIERCFFNYVNWSATGQYATIRQCYSTGDVYGRGSTDQQSAFCTIENCILIRNSYCINNLYHPIIRNNYLKCTSNGYCLYQISQGTIVNNIILNSNTSSRCLSNVSDVIFANNVLSADNGSSDNIKNVTSESAIFALEGSNDQRYQLKADSPAKNHATDGGDCGPYGGRYPYVPSGYPFGMPRFNSSVVGARPQSGQVSVTQEVTIQKQ